MPDNLTTSGNTATPVGDPLTTALLDPPSGTTSLGASPDSDIVTKRFPVPGLESYLGRGYSLLDGYATPDAVRMPIFDISTQDTWVEQQTLDKSIQLDPGQLSTAFSVPPAEAKLIYRRPSKVGYTDYFKATTVVDDVKTSSDETTNWGVGGEISGSYMGFSADVKARFDSKMTRLASTQMATVCAQIVYWKLDLLSGYSLNAPPPLREDTKSDFATRSVEALLKAYGSHCIISFGMGSKIALHYVLDTSKFTHGIDLKASLSAAYSGGDVNAGVSVDGTFQDAAANDAESLQVEIEAQGVSDTQLGNISARQGKAEHPMAILQQGWHNPTLIAFDSTSLTPLWEVEGLMTPKKAAEFKVAFEAQARAQNVGMAEVFANLSPLYLFSSGPMATARYRLSTKAHYQSAAGTAWTNVLADMEPAAAGKPAAEASPGSPWLLIDSEQKAGMVGLYEFALNGNTDIVRYETDTWIDLINQDKDKGYEWQKVSSKPLGYVYESPKVGGPPPPKGDPVYAFYDTSHDPAKGVFYSAMKQLVWDGGRWTSLPEQAYSMHEIARYAQQQADETWNQQNWFYKAFHTKGQLSVGFAADHQGDPLMITPGLPHWYAADGIVTVHPSQPPGTGTKLLPHATPPAGKPAR